MEDHTYHLRRGHGGLWDSTYLIDRVSTKGIALPVTFMCADSRPGLANSPAPDSFESIRDASTESGAATRLLAVHVTAI